MLKGQELANKATGTGVEGDGKLLVFIFFFVLFDGGASWRRCFTSSMERNITTFRPPPLRVLAQNENQTTKASVPRIQA